MAAAVVAALALAVFIGKGTFEYWHSWKVERCGMTPPGSPHVNDEIGARWQWWTPGYVCTYNGH
jgi:hypothetical protein